MSGTIASFQPSDTFQGAREGFHFKSGNQGIGYYADHVPVAAAAVVAAEPVLLSVEVPDGAEAGDIMQVQVPTTGEWIDVAIPEGAVAGSKIQVTIGGGNTSSTTTTT